MKKNIICTLFLLLSYSFAYSMCELDKVIQTQEINGLINRNVDRQDPRWSTCLFSSILNYPDLVKKILKNGISPNIQQPVTLMTALHRTAFKCSLIDIKLLLEYNANPNILNADGETALMLAVTLENNNFIDEGRREKTVLLLLHANSDTTLVNNKGQTAADIARNNKLYCIADLIEHYPYHNSLKNQCIRFIKTHRSLYAKNDWDTLPTTLEELFRICNTCKAEKSPTNKLLVCGQCKKVYYCNRDCQKKDWHRHKDECEKSKKKQN